MNERIRQLAEQAGITTNLDTDYFEKDINKWVDYYSEKFAELIVRECARVARATPAPNFHEHLKQQLGHTWDMASSEAGREIVKHFGVEQ
jgi:hypothetical protein